MKNLARAFVMLLSFPDGSVEICDWNNYVIDYTRISVSVNDCVADTIFGNGFESRVIRNEDSSREVLSR